MTRAVRDASRTSSGVRRTQAPAFEPLRQRTVRPRPASADAGRTGGALHPGGDRPLRSRLAAVLSEVRERRRGAPLLRERERIWSPRPNSSHFTAHPDTGEYIPVFYNDFGMRQHRQFDPQMLDGATNVAFFGDSFTENRRIRSAYSFTESLDFLLNLHEGAAFNVLKFGVDGYGPGQEVIWYRQFEAARRAGPRRLRLLRQRHRRLPSPRPLLAGRRRQSDRERRGPDEPVDFAALPAAPDLSGARRRPGHESALQGRPVRAAPPARSGRRRAADSSAGGKKEAHSPAMPWTTASPRSKRCCCAGSGRSKRAAARSTWRCSPTYARNGRRRSFRSQSTSSICTAASAARFRTTATPR